MSLEPAPVPHLSAAQKIAVTIDPQVRAAGEALFGSLVRQLRELSETTGAALMLIPHAFGKEPSDLTEARVLAERIGVPQTGLASGLDARQARRLAGDAALVISSRYHPIVFALAAGVPPLGVYGDEYCRIKLQGALAHASLERWTLTYDDVARGGLLANALALWRTRDDVRHELESRRQAWREETRQRWAAILRALDPATTIAPAGTSTIFGRPMGDLAPALVGAIEARREAWEWQTAIFERLAARCEKAEGYARWLERENSLRRIVRRLVAGFRRSRSHQRSQREP
jgi:hypothetical protein